MARTSCLDRPSLRVALGAAALFSAAASAHALPSNVNTDAVYCWGENIGYLNLRDSGSPPTTNGVFISQLRLSGFIWAENVGYISVGDGTPGGPAGQYTNADGADTGVNIDSSGDLFGYAWGENVGWINLDDARPAMTTVCPADFSGDGVRTVDDVFIFIAQWFKSDPRCDIDHDGAVTIDDIFIFITIWFQGC